MHQHPGKAQRREASETDVAVLKVTLDELDHGEASWNACGPWSAVMVNKWLMLIMAAVSK